MKVTANIATYPPRKESLKRMLKSIEGQFDEVRVCFNDWPVKHIGEGFHDLDFESPIKITACIASSNHTDNGKFIFLDTVEHPEKYCTLDDDLIYPPDYRKRLEAAIDHYKCIISFHGRQLLGTGLNYYTDHKIFHCIHGVIHDEIVDVVGTGVTGFDTRYFHPKGLANSPDQRMSDLVFSLEAAKQNKQMGVISHAPNWIGHIDNKESIFFTEASKGTPRQNQIANEIFQLRYGSKNS